MKIGIYIGKLKPDVGGGFSLESTILNSLLETKSNHEFYIISSQKIDIPLKSNFFSIPLYEKDNLLQNIRFKKFIIKVVNSININCNNKYLKYNFSLSNRIEKLIHKYNIDIMWFIAPGHISVKIPYITTSWDLAHRAAPFFPEVSITGWRWEDRENYYLNILPKATYILTGTFAGKDEIIHFYNIRDERIRVIPFPVPTFALPENVSQSKATNNFNISKKYLFYPAQFWPHKNHIGLLLALKILHEKYSLDFDLIFTGSDKGNLKYIKRKAEELNLSKKVHFLGFVSTDRLVDLYKNAFAMVFPTFLGPDNLPPLEAFSLGCPVIASRVKGAEEQLGDAALLFDPKNEEEIAFLVNKLYNDLDLRESLINSGKKLAIKRHPYKYVKEVISIIDEFESYRRCWSNKEIYIHT
jgi:glycosyltransferase involved in cell wall biosynthesis